MNVKKTFAARISKEGSRYIIIVPKQFAEENEDLKGKVVVVGIVEEDFGVGDEEQGADR